MTKYRWIVAAGLVRLFMVVGSPLRSVGMPNSQPQTYPGIPTEDLLDSTTGAEGDFFNYIPMLRKSQAAYYVSVSGSDVNPGTLAAPWRTLQHAADTAPAGAIVYVRGGIYQGFTLERSCLTFSGSPGETVAVVGDGQSVNTINVRNTRGVVIRSRVIQDNPVAYGTGINVEDASLVTISDNLFQDNQGFGVVLKNVSQVTVEDNEFRYNASAIEVRYGSDEVYLAYVNGFGNTASFEEFRAWTGYEADGLNVNPLFTGYTQRDYTLTSESPAIDAGVMLFEPFYGLAPDLGRFEYMP
jgi:parallel beta-helix repeat protein